VPSDRSLAPFGIAFAVIAAGFLASTFYVEARSGAIDHEIDQMELNSVPSVAHLASARVALRHLQNGIEHFTHAPPDAREAAKQSILTAEVELGAGIAGERETPNYPGEIEAYALAKQSIDEIEDAIATWFAGNHGKAPPPELDLADEFDRADKALLLWSTINGSHQSEEIAMIKEVRSETVRLALLLDGACAALAIVASFIALRALRRQRETEEAHAQLLSGRANELEMFAKRVAHDLLSPLSSLSFLLGTIGRNVANGGAVAEPLARADACLRRSRRLVDGALEFARSGVSSPSATGGMAASRADLKETIAGVIDEVRADEGASAEIVVEPFEPVVVACASGVLTSVVSNLVRNATKFSEERETRRITLRAHPRGPASVRVEVEDTGPGLPAGLEGSVFDPYVRGADTKPGLGLGLATVRRFVEGHGGTVGVESTPGRGCVFWFELPTVSGANGVGAAKSVSAAGSPA
jgi:signal transduction histidine kinase